MYGYNISSHMCTTVVYIHIRVYICLDVYNRCIYKFDHYCIWIRNCVGGNNHRYFLLLLASLALMCIHGALATFKVIQAVIQVFGLKKARYLDAINGSPMKITNYVLFQVYTLAGNFCKSFCKSLSKVCFQILTSRLSFQNISYRLSSIDLSKLQHIFKYNN